MSRSDAILDRAKSGLLSRQEVAAVARELSAGDVADAYTAIHVLGLMRATEYEELVAGFLDAQDDPMLARIALQVLCSHWGMARRYRDPIERLARGVEWDTDEDVRITAISAAGELCREFPDKALVALLMSIFRSVRESDMVRQAAYFALARAAGRQWDRLPSASRKIDFASDVDSTVLEWASECSKVVL